MIQERTGIESAPAMQRGMRFGRPLKLGAAQWCWPNNRLRRVPRPVRERRCSRSSRYPLYRALNAIMPFAGSDAEPRRLSAPAGPDLPAH